MPCKAATQDIKACCLSSYRARTPAGRWLQQNSLPPTWLGHQALAQLCRLSVLPSCAASAHHCGAVKIAGHGQLVAGQEGGLGMHGVEALCRGRSTSSI